MSQELILSLLKVLTIVSAQASLFLIGWELGKDKTIQTKQLIWLWGQRILTIFLGMAFLTLDLLFSIRMVP